MINLAAEATREEYALRLGLPADTEPWDILRAVLFMTHEEVRISDLQGLVRDMGGVLRISLRRLEAA